MPRDKLWKIGTVVEISISEKQYAYGIVIDSVIVGFTGTYDKNVTDLSRLLRDIRFKIWVMKYAIGKKGWPVVGNVSLSDEVKSNRNSINSISLRRNFISTLIALMTSLLLKRNVKC